MYARIESAGYYLPSKALGNDAFSYLDTSDEWIQQRTGIIKRHIAADDENATDLACKAAKDIMATTQIKSEQIDAIIIATASQHQAMPSIACKVANHINAGDCFALDINAACSGFVYALQLAQASIGKQWQYVLVIGSDTMSKMLNWEDRATCVLFGDAAAGVLLKASEEPGILDVACQASGQGHSYLYTNGDKWQNKACTLLMQGNEVYRRALAKQVDITEALLEKNAIAKESIHWCIPHQANKRIIIKLMQQLNIDQDRAIITVDKHANTSAASIPLALAHAIRSAKIQRGQRLLMQAFGAGFTWGAAIIDY